MMRRILFFITITFLFTTLSAFTNNGDSTKKIKILLIGDSTTAGGKGVFEESIEDLLSGEKGVPPVDVVNLGLGGETAYSLMNSGRYDKQIKGIDSVDYIFLRYGINDWIHRKPFAENFPSDMKNVLTQLRTDFPEAEIIVMTIIPFLKEEDTKLVNEYIAQIADEEGLALFDIYPAYKKGLEEFGENSMNVRFYALSEIPEKYQALVAPYARYYRWKDAEWVSILTNEFDPLFGELPGWYKDRHPNPTGYRLIAKETAEYLLPRLR